MLPALHGLRRVWRPYVLYILCARGGVFRFLGIFSGLCVLARFAGGCGLGFADKTA